MSIAQTERLVLREMDSALDAEFIFELLNSPKFVRFIGDRGVRSTSEAAEFIEAAIAAVTVTTVTACTR